MKTPARLLAVMIFSAFAAALPGFAQEVEVTSDAGMIAITDAIAVVTERFEGQIVAAELQPGRLAEMTETVYAFRLLTPLGDILAIRVDAANGDILEVDGRGLVDARRPSVP